MHDQLTKRSARSAAFAALGLAVFVWNTRAYAQGDGTLLDPSEDASSAPAVKTASQNIAPNDSDAEAVIASLGQSAGSDAAAEAVADVDEFKLNIYGFTDFTYTQRLNDFTYASPYPTFMVGNANIYVGAELGKGWRSLMEFRLMYEPNGNVPASEALAAHPERQDTTVADPADYGRPQRWGGIEIERAWLEYTVSPLLTIQGGQWLTPYGIWIVDHGSPVIIGVRRPYVVGEELFPERQTGVQIYGSLFAGRTEVGYHLGLSNGRGPLDTYQDLDKNKAVTARLFVTTDDLVGTLTLGGSLYRGRYTDRYSRYGFAATGQTGTEYITTSQYEELGIAGDLRWIWKELTLQAELIVHDTSYGDRVRPVELTSAGEPPGFTPDYRSTGWYVMGAYRLPWYNIMPFFGGESSHPHQRYVDPAGAVWGGINWRPIPRVVLKAQYTQSWFLDHPNTIGQHGLKALDLQAAWSF